MAQQSSTFMSMATIPDKAVHRDSTIQIFKAVGIRPVALDFGDSGVMAGVGCAEALVYLLDDLQRRKARQNQRWRYF